MLETLLSIDGGLLLLIQEYARTPLLDKIMARASGIAEEMTTGPIDDDDDGMMGAVEE